MIKIDIFEADPLCELRFNLETDPAIQPAVDFKARSPNQELAVKFAASQRPGPILHAMVLRLKTPTKFEPKVVIT